MIQDKRNIQIKSSPEIVFDLIETMPNKFPIYKILETKPFVFLRLLLVDGLRSAIGAMHINKPDDILILNVGDSIGPFTITESEKPFNLRWAIVELTAYTRQMSFRYSRLCGKTSNALDAVRSATPSGVQILGGHNDLSYYQACHFSCIPKFESPILG